MVKREMLIKWISDSRVPFQTNFKASGFSSHVINCITGDEKIESKKAKRETSTYRGERPKNFVVADQGL